MGPHEEENLLHIKEHLQRTACGEKYFASYVYDRVLVSRTWDKQT